jgi:hypothetical protein
MFDISVVFPFQLLIGVLSTLAVSLERLSD